MDNASWLEVAWTGMALVAGSFNLRIWWDALADWRWTQASDTTTRAREVTAVDQLVTHSFLLSVQVVMFVIGMLAMVTPSANPNHVITAIGYIVASGLMLIEVMLAAMAILSRRSWRRVLRLIEAQRRRQLEATG